MKVTTVEVNLKNGNMPVRSYEFTYEEWELIFECIQSYFLNIKNLNKDFLNQGFLTIYNDVKSLAEKVHNIMVKINE